MTTNDEAAGLSPRDAAYYRRVGRAKTPQALEDAFARGRREVGDRVSFPSHSAPSGLRSGRILKCGPRRALVGYKFFNGRETTKSVPYGKLR